MGLLIFALICISLVIWFILRDYYSTYEYRQDEKLIKEVLGDFDISQERQKVIRLLRKHLPEEYRCGRAGCRGILLKQETSNLNANYVCSDCKNIRKTVRRRLVYEK